MLAIVNFKDHLPRRRRKDWPINRKGKLATKRRRNVVANVKSVIRLQLVEVLTQVRRNGFHYPEQIIDKPFWILYYKASHHIGIRGDIFERTHRCGSCQPGRNAMLRVIERKHSACMGFSFSILLIEYKVLHAQNS